MKESIYTIPISEVFEPMCGCPLCTLYSQLETRWVEYISGAAMMEPAVRIETNRQGFCAHHFDMMLAVQKRLSVALILQSRLIHLRENLTQVAPEKKPLFGRKEPLREAEDCFVCERIEQEFSRIGENIAVVWQREPAFRTLYSQQEFFCHPHYELLAQAGANVLKGKQRDEFIEETARITTKKLDEVKGQIDEFCFLFDHRSAGSGRPSPEVAGAIDHAIAYLTAGYTQEENGANNK